MSTRRSAISTGSLGRSSASERASRATSSDSLSANDHEVAYETERQRSRLLIRSGSPRPAAKVALRENTSPTQSGLKGTKSTRVPIPSTKAGTTPPSSLRMTSPSRLSTLPSSLRIKSPARQPWNAPPIRNSVYAQQSLSKRKKASDQQETSKPRSPPKPRRICYSVSELLSLRPIPLTLPLAVPRVTPGNAWVNQPVVRHDRRTTFLHGPGTYAPPAPVVSSSQLMGMLADLQPFPASPISAGHWHHVLPPLHRLPPVFNSEGWNAPLPVENHPRTQSVDSPIKSHSKEYSSEDQAASVEDLETKIRSALSNRGRRRSFLGGARNIRSVRWDPSLPVDDASSLEHLEKQDSTPAASTTSVSHDGPIKAAHLDNVDAVPHAVPKESTEKVHKKDFQDYLKNIAQLKKGDRQKLVQILEAMSGLDSDGSDSEGDQQARAAQPEQTSCQNGTKLNPAAVVFPGSPPLLQRRESNTASCTESAEKLPKVTQSRVAIPGTPRPEPVWIKKTDLLPRSHQRLHHAGDENLPYVPPRANGYSPAAWQPDNSDTSRTNISRSANQVAFEKLPFVPFLSMVPLSFDTVSLPPPSPLALEGSTNPNELVADFTTGYVPSEGDFGREAQALPFGRMTLERFKKKYPLTGTRLEPAAVEDTQAARIQQRLEYLLMQQKERKAYKDSLAVIGYGMPAMEALQINHDKQVLKRLKSEIRKEDIAKRNRELTSDSNSSTDTKSTIKRVRVDRSSEESQRTETTISSTSSVDDAPDAEKEQIV